MATQAASAARDRAREAASSPWREHASFLWRASLLPLAIVAIWSAVTDGGFIPKYILPSPAQVIAAAKVPMRAKEMVTEMESKGLWKSPGGKTPEATLYAAIIREIAAKGDKARFKKHDKGVFVAGKGA